MCAIVDNDMRSLFFSSPVDPELQPLWKWIADGKGMLVVGGRLRQELYESANARRAIQEWIRTRRATDMDDAYPGEVEAETGRVDVDCRSNDAHVIALARVSGARLLCSSDGDLQADFTDRKLLRNPRGHVYQNREHTRLLTHNGRCPQNAIASTRRSRRR